MNYTATHDAYMSEEFIHWRRRGVKTLRVEMWQRMLTEISFW